MELKLFTGVCALLLCTAHAFPVKDKELIYDYEGTIIAGTQIPKVFLSKFKLTGELHVQTGADSALVSLKNPKYELYNGANDDYESKELPIPEDQHDFTKTFKVKFEPSGNIDGISTYGNEKQYVVNFKKAIGSLFQLNVEAMGKHEQRNYAFHAEETSLYGTGKVYYNVQTDKSSYHLIEVMQQPNDTKHLYRHGFTNVDYENEDWDEQLSRDCQRKVYLGKDSVIEWVKQTGGVYHQPFNAQGEAHAVYVSQNLTLKEAKSIGEKMEVSGEELYHDGLEYYAANFENIDSTFPDFTNGRRNFVRDGMIGGVFDLIKQVKELRKDYKIKASEPDYKQAFLLHEITEELYSFDEKMLDELFGKILDLSDEKFVDIYIECLIETGSHSVYHHLIKMIKEEKITEQNGDSIQNLFVNVKYPNTRLVDDMAQVLKWDYSTVGGMKGRVIMSFGTLLKKAIYRHDTFKIDAEMSDALKKEFPDEEYYEKHIQTIVDLLKSAEQKDKQILYLQTLQNTEFDSLVEHLAPYINGNLFKDDYLKLLAVYAVAPVMVDNDDLIFETLWPIITDTTKQTSLRIGAYFMLMQSKPDLPRLINIYWMMESMKNQEIYKFHYDYIKERSEAEDPESWKFSLGLRQILKYTSKPQTLSGLSFYDCIDYFDSDYAIGEQIDVAMIHSKNEDDLIFTGWYKYNTNGLLTYPDSVFIRVSGFETSLLKELKLDPTSKNFLFTWDAAFKSLLSAIKNKDASITVIYAKNGNVVYSAHYENLDDYYQLYKLYAHDKREFLTSMISPSFELSQFTIIPTDMGFPAIYFNRIINLDFLNFNLFKGQTNGDYMIETNVKMMMNGRRGLAFYNPVLDIQQGVAKMNFIDHEMNMRLNFTLDYEHGTFKAFWDAQNPREAMGKDMYLDREYATGVVFIEDDHNKGILKKSNGNCKNYEKVSMGRNYIVKRDGDSLPLFDIGHDYTEKIFDLENSLPKDLDPNYAPELESGDKEDLKSYIRSVIRSALIEQLQPENVNYGTFRHIYMNGFYTITKFELRLKFDTEYTKGGNLLYPAATHKFKLHFAGGNPEAEVTTWVADMKLTRDEGHLNNDFEFNLAKTLGDFEVKVCGKGDTVWGDEELKGKLQLSTNMIEGLSCDGKDPLITFEMHAEKSKEQLENAFPYSACYENAKGLIKNGKTMDCLFEYSALRKYTFKITHMMPDEKQKEYGDKLDGAFDKIFTDVDSIKPLEDVVDNEIRIIFETPMRPASDAKVLVYTKGSGMSYEVSEKVDTTGISTVLGTTYDFMHELGLTDVCVIDNSEKKIFNANAMEIEYKATEDWELFFEQSKYQVFILSPGANHMAIKIVEGEHFLNIAYAEKGFLFILDGTKLDENVTHLTNEWVHFACVKDTKLVSIYVKTVGSHIIYNGDQVSIEYSPVHGVEMHGRCMDKSNRTN